MDVGANVWIPDATNVWIPAIVDHTDNNGVLTVRVHGGDHPATMAMLRQMTLTYQPTSANASAIECTNVLLQNAPEDQDQEDLVTLPHLHEASILHSLRLRYGRKAIYTRIGDILISINPFQDVSYLYTTTQIQDYASSSTHQPPHVFQVARHAFTDVQQNHRNQSILISGESGAGKTEATKILLKYFTTTCGNVSSSIEAQVLQSNPILEAFGNARTVRNDNSSRFGKFIQLQLNEQHVISGAQVQTYLLEKIRVIQQATNERNFHIFYELLASASSLSSRFGLDGLTPLDFTLLNQSNCITRRDHVDDQQQFEVTINAMQTLGLTTEEIQSVLEIVTAILHLGNVAFHEVTCAHELNVNKAQITTTSLEHFTKAAELLGVAPSQLNDALTQRRLVTATETLTVQLDQIQANETKAALLMECYRLLFEWIVTQINLKTQPHGIPVKNCIGLLDIFGFEDMNVNSLEQFCINYANEALQQQFNQYVFHEEQKLYETEGIAWTFVDFPHNELCLELLEKKPMGLISLLDQECLFPKGTDDALITKYYQAFHDKQAHFVSAKSWQRQSLFGIKHYAGVVMYHIHDFCRKNKDVYCETANALLASSVNCVMQSMVKSSESSCDRKIKSVIGAQSVASQFKSQLLDLLGSIRTTLPHYVRCIKPNDTNVANTFTATRVVEQLRSGGVLEAVRVARAGFPVRLDHRQFLSRYQRVLLSNLWYSDTTSTDASVHACVERIQHLLPSEEALGVKMGATKVFFRRQPYETLESWRSQLIAQAAIVLQTCARRFVAQTKFERLQKATTMVQKCIRGHHARQFVRSLRQTKAATRLQSTVRVFLHRQRYLHFRSAVLQLQSHWRRHKATRHVQFLRNTRAVTQISSCFRCFISRSRYRNFRSAVGSLQRQQRVRVAKKQLMALRLEQQNVTKLQQDNLQLKDQVNDLRLQLLAMKAVMLSTTVELNEDEEEDEEESRNDNQEASPHPAKCIKLLTSPRNPTLESPKAMGLTRAPSLLLLQTQVDAQVESLKVQLKDASRQPDAQKQQERVVHEYLIKSKSMRWLPSPLRHSEPMVSNNNNQHEDQRILSNTRSFYGDLSRSMSMRLSSSSVANVPRWSKDSRCKECNCKFNWLTRRHHCRHCGHSFCYEHSTRKLRLPQLGYETPERVCDECFEWHHMMNMGT